MLRSGGPAARMCVALLFGVWICGAQPARNPVPGGAALPKPHLSGGMSLNEALATRRSQRAFSARPLAAGQISQLCWAAQGVTEPEKGLRTAPSAMETYPIHVLLADPAGLREYVPATHSLRVLRSGNVLADLRRAVSAPSVGTAPAAMVVAMDLAPLQPRAGAKAERYALLECGHVAQNVLLEATALGLASVPIGGADEGAVSRALELRAGLRPVYVLPLGYAAAR